MGTASQSTPVPTQFVIDCIQLCLCQQLLQRSRAKAHIAKAGKDDAAPLPLAAASYFVGQRPPRPVVHRVRASLCEGSTAQQLQSCAGLLGVDSTVQLNFARQRISTSLNHRSRIQKNLLLLIHLQRTLNSFRERRRCLRRQCLLRDVLLHFCKLL